MSTRVYVTGIGLLTPIGNTWEEFSESLRAGSNGFRTIPYFDTAAFPFQQGAIIPEFPADFLTLAADHPEWETAEHYGVHCASVALADAGMSVDALDPFRTAVVVASSNAGVETNHAHAEKKLSGQATRGSTVVRTPATVTAAIRRTLGVRGPKLRCRPPAQPAATPSVWPMTSSEPGAPMSPSRAVRSRSRCFPIRGSPCSNR